MTTLREAAQQALEALEYAEANHGGDDCYADSITALRAALVEDVMQKFTDVNQELEAALAEPVQDIEDAIEAAYWHFDARKKGLNEWASAPQSERDAFKAEARKLVRGYFPTRQAQDTKREMLAVADAFIRGKRAALAEPVQEPVAYVDQRIHGWPDCFVMEADPPHTTPLYAAPPQRKALTEEELDALAIDENGLPNSHIEFARAVERAHGVV